MLEIPETNALSGQLRDTITGKTVQKAVTNASPHKFAFFFADPAAYSERLSGKTVTHADAAAGFIRIFCDKFQLLFNDGVNLRYYAPSDPVPEKHQLLIEFTDGSKMVCTVQMYEGLAAFDAGEYENPYYTVALEKPSPLSEEFDLTYFLELFSGLKATLSIKAFLATEQRIPGLGNGCLQDILFNARINPHTKINALTDEAKANLFDAVKNTLRTMTEQGGRNTERDLFGNPGGYHTILSSLSWQNPCLACGGAITKQAYLGGSVYFCPHCQPIL